jgi:hypothetical protein
LADAELVYGDQVPTGTYLDMTMHLPVVDPTKVRSPVAVVRGELDGIATMEDLWDFFRQLPNGDRQISVIGGRARAGDVPQPPRLLACGAGVPDDARSARDMNHSGNRETASSGSKTRQTS